MKRFLCIVLSCLLLAVPVSAAEDVKYVALTFDDGPSGRYTRELLAGLEERGVDATFFLCGYRLETYGGLVDAIRAGGHEIGLHGYSHDSMASMTQSQVAKELEDTAGMLSQVPCLNLMRAPGGKTTASVSGAAQDQGLAILNWSLDPQDWATDSAEVIFQRVVSKVRDGDVILLHDMSDSSVQAALMIVDELQGQGYRFLTVSQLALLRLTHLNSGQEYTGFPPK